MLQVCNVIVSKKPETKCSIFIKPNSSPALPRICSRPWEVLNVRIIGWVDEKHVGDRSIIWTYQIIFTVIWFCRQPGMHAIAVCIIFFRRKRRVNKCSTRWPKYRGTKGKSYWWYSNFSGKQYPQCRHRTQDINPSSCHHKFPVATSRKSIK